jgi:multiple sugar transport system ATP-binding protein
VADVKFDRVSKIYPGMIFGPSAVELSLTIADGEFMVLVGPSGCGKTTALRMVAGLEEITDGTLSIGGTVMNNVLPKDRDIAMVFQNYALYPQMTVAQNMGFALKIRGVAKSEIASGCARRPGSCDWMITSIDDPKSSRADNANAWRWVARSCASPRPS